MTTFNDRERGFENKFALDQDQVGSLTFDDLALLPAQPEVIGRIGSGCL